MRSVVLTWLLCTSLMSSSAQNVWNKKLAFGGGKRERAVGFAIAGKGYVCTGQDTANLVQKDLWEYSPGSNSWTQKADLPGVGRRNATAFTIGNVGYVGSGMSHAESSMGTTLKDFYAYDPTVNGWTTIADYPGGWGNGIYFATSFSADSKGYVCCGKMGPSNYTDQMWEYKPSVDQWIQRATFPGGDRYQLISFSINDKGYVGLGTDENWYMGDFWEFHPGTNVWTQLNDFPGVERSSSSTFVLNDRGFVACGGDGGYLDDFWEYDPLTDQWTLRAPFSGDARRNAFAFAINGRGYLGGGKGFTGLRRNFYEYTPNTLSVNDDQEVRLNLYPNPVVDQVKWQASFTTANVRVYSASGELVMNEISNGQLDVSNLPGGNYQIEFQIEDIRITKQLVKL